MNTSKQSVTITSLFVFGAIWIGQQAGIAIGEGEILTTIATLGKFAAIAGVYWGRYRIGDINFFGAKK